MAEVFESVIKIETGDSEQSVKGLKKQISDLRDHILNLEKGTDEYNDAVEQLMDSQRRLDEVMSLTKRTATALDGSYDALAHKMALLKKEWKATNDEARRNELGRQIDELNDQLKELDASTGNFQRNVGNYPKEMGKMQEATKETAVACKSFQQQMSEMNESIEPTKQKFEAVSNIASGLAGGFAAVQGAMALLGVESEGFERTMIKIQAAMALAQGIGGMKGLVEGIGKAKVAFKGIITSIKAVTAAMSTTGWLAVIVAVTAAIVGLVSWIKKASKESDALSKDMASMAEKSIEIASGLGEEIAKLKIYQSVAEDVRQSQENRNLAAAEGLRLLGEEINQTNIAAFKNGEYATKINEVTQALLNKAKVEGAYEVIKEKYNKALQKQLELEEQARKAQEEANKLKELQKNNQTTTEQEVAAFGFNMMANDPMTGNYGGSSEVTTAEDVRDADIEIWERRAKEYTTAAKKVMTDADKELNDFVTKLSQDSQMNFLPLLGGTETSSTTTTTTTTTTTKPEDPNATLKKSIKERIQLESQATQRKLANLEVERQKEVANAYATINDKDKLEAELERIEQLYAGKEYDIEQELLNKKLDILKEWKEANTDAEIERIEIAEEIADTEVEIEQSKQNRLTEIAKQGNEERNKITTPVEETSEDPTEEVKVGLKMVDDFKQQVKDFNEQWKSMNFTAKAAEIGNVVTTSLQGASQIFNQLADMYANEEELSKEEMKKVKNLRIAGATMDMLSGIVGAISSTAGMGPVGWVLGGIQSAIIATTGALNIANIKKQDVSGNSSGDGGSGASVTPANTAYATELPATYTRQITGASEVDALNQDQRVYILESDIQASNKRVEVRENESSF